MNIFTKTLSFLFIFPLSVLSAYFSYPGGNSVSLAGFPNGDLAIGWRYSLYTIYLEILDSADVWQTYGNNHIIVQDNSAGQNLKVYPPSVTVLYDSHIVIAWTMYIDSTNIAAFFAMYNAQRGLIMGKTQMISSADQNVQVVVANLTVNHFAALTRYQSSTGGIRLKYHLYTAWGVYNHGPVTALGTYSTSIAEGQIAIAGLSNSNSQETFVMVASDDTNIYFRILAYGVLDSGVITMGAGHYPGVAGLPNGDFVIVYRCVISGAYCICGQVLSYTGSVVVAQVKLDTETTFTPIAPSVTAMPLGGIMVTYQKNHNTNPSIRRYDNLLGNSDGIYTAITEIYNTGYSPVVVPYSSFAVELGAYAIGTTYFGTNWQANVDVYILFNLTTNSMTIKQGKTVTVTTSNLFCTNYVSAAIGAITFTVSNLLHGSFRNSANAQITSFTDADVSASNIKFVHDGSAIAPSYMIGFKAGVYGYAPMFPPTVSFFLMPAVTKNVLTIKQGKTITLTTAMINAVDTQYDLSFSIQTISHGTFKVSGTTATSFFLHDLTSGTVTFTHDGTTSTPSYSIVVSDGTDSSASSSATITFIIMPVITANSLTLQIETNLTINSSMINGGGQSGYTLTFTVSSLSHMYFVKSSSKVTTFTTTDISNKNIIAVLDGTNILPSYKLVLSDGYDSTPISTPTIVLIFVTLTNYQLTVYQGQTLKINSSMINGTKGSTYSLSFLISNLNNGRFEMTSSPGVAITSFTQNDVLASKIT